MSTKNAVIIGAGVAGMAAALRLRKQGFDVTVYESSHTYGGKVKEYRWEEFRFDCGPSLFTLPELVDELFILFNKDPRAYFRYQALDSITKYFYEDGIQINSYANPTAFAAEVSQKLNIKEKTVLDFLSQQSSTYKLLAPIFLENPIHLIHKLFKIKNLPALLRVMDPRFLLSMNWVNMKWFKNDYLTKLFNRYGTYNGSNPFVMPSLFNIISHLEHNAGAYLPENGMRSIVDMMYKLAIEEGVEFRFNQYVEKIKVLNNKAVGIAVNGEIKNADIVVSNMDVNNAYSQLLSDRKQPKIFLQNQKSTSALIFHWAVDIESQNLDVHNILFAKNYKEEFEYLFDKKEIYFDPTIYIYISSKAVTQDAPNGSENWFVMINMPHLDQWKLDIELVKTQILSKIKAYVGLDIKSRILHENTITPADLANTTHSFLGSLYGASSNSIISAFLRHPNFSNIKNLYFCGGTVHPGGGIPLSLLSAKITAELIKDSK